MGRLNVDGTEIQVLQIKEDDYSLITSSGSFSTSNATNVGVIRRISKCITALFATNMFIIATIPISV